MSVLVCLPSGDLGSPGSRERWGLAEPLGASSCFLSLIPGLVPFLPNQILACACPYSLSFVSCVDMAESVDADEIAQRGSLHPGQP